MAKSVVVKRTRPKHNTSHSCRHASLSTKIDDYYNHTYLQEKEDIKNAVSTITKISKNNLRKKYKDYLVKV